MTSPRSMFTEAIEDHLALKKQNSHLEAAMPVQRFDVGDPLDRYPGGPVRPATGAEEAAAGAPVTVDPPVGAALTATAAAAGAMLSTDQASVLEGDFRRPLEPLNGMTPMLSLVEDLDEDDDSIATSSPVVVTSNAALATEATMTAVLPDTDAAEGSVVRFPGGSGPREEQTALETDAASEVEETGEQPVIVIDADEPLAPISPDRSVISSRMAEPRRRPTFFGLRRKKKEQEQSEGAGWFAQAPRDFDWD